MCDLAFGLTRVLLHAILTFHIDLSCFYEEKLIECVIFFSDGISLSEYQLTDGSKINLVVKREACSSSSQTGFNDIKIILNIKFLNEKNPETGK